MGLALLVVVLLELGLRAGGIGADAREPFRTLPGHDEILAFNPEFPPKYFQGFRPAAAFTPFRRTPPSDGLRVFVLGGSSTAGYPYQFYHGFPGRLEEVLQARLPTRPVEVVNLGLTAVNSYTLWDLATDVADQRPDAVLIYAGHNEYYGAFGAGSTVHALGNRTSLKRLVLRLKRTALYSLLERALTPAPAAPQGESRTTMARVVRDATITYGGEVYQAGIDQFSDNMSAAVEVFTEAGIPVYVGTLASNLRDQPPLGSAPEALAAYAAGQEALAAGDTTAARAAFLEAKEKDDIRFRAPEALNEQLRTLAARPGVTLVDVQAALRAHSPGGLEGAALFDDHLHPNAQGNDVVAQAFAEALAPLANAQAPVAPAQVALDTTYRPDVLDAAHAALQISRLRLGYPFDKTIPPAEEAAAFRALLERYRSGSHADSLAAALFAAKTVMPNALLEEIRYQKQQADTTAVLRLYASLLHWQPFNTALMREAVGYAVNAPRYDTLVGPLARYSAQHTDDVYFYNVLAAIRLRQGSYDAATALLAFIEERTPEAPAMLYNQARLALIQGDTSRAQSYFERYRAQR